MVPSIFGTFPEKCSLSSSQTGLVFMTYGLTYTVFTPLFGFLTDKGLDGPVAMLLGNLFITFGLIFLGPIPPLQFLGSNLWLTIFSIGMQGLGSAATYLGTLLYMMKNVALLQDSDQANSMVSSLWVVSDCAGGFIGMSLGSLSYDILGFERGMVVISFATSITVLLVGIYIFNRRVK